MESPQEHFRASCPEFAASSTTARTHQTVATDLLDRPTDRSLYKRRSTSATACDIRTAPCHRAVGLDRHSGQTAMYRPILVPKGSLAGVLPTENHPTAAAERAGHECPFASN